MAVLFVLFENATGYSLFKVPEFEESSSIVKVHESIRDISAFGNIVEPVSFKPFTSGRDALENMSSASTGVLHPSLQQFLESNLPKSKKKHPVMLGVADSKLGAVITEALGVSCSVSGIVPDILRGIRLHYHKLIKDVRDQTSVIDAQKGLSHHYCRATLKYNVGKVDNMIIQSINIIDQLDKDINNFSMRVREWYSHHFPELIKVVPENHFYIQCVSAIQNRKNMPEDIKEKLETILMDSAKAQDIIELARTSMGMEISVLDMENVTTFAKRINALIIRRKELMEYLKSKMHNIAPNLATLIGDVVGARLIAHAGSLVNLAKFPASTVQILGAEKALFRALKTRGNTPKYGLIYHSSYIGRAGKANKGRISRYLANKCVVASRIDFFREIPTEVFGTKLKQQVEDRLKFYETGEIPAKNVDVMSVALEEADLAAVSVAKEKRKAEKREKKRRSQLLESITQNSFNASTNEDNGEILEENVSPKKKRKRLSEQSENASFVDGNEDNEISEHDSSAKKKKKKRKLSEQLADVSQNSVNTVEDNEEASEQNMTSSEKKKKHKYMEVSEIDVSSPHNQAEVEETEITDPEILRQIRKAKKKEKKRLKALQASMNSTGEDSMFSNNESMFTNDSINSSMNTPSKVNEEEHLDNGIKKKKKKKKNKHQDEECEA